MSIGDFLFGGSAPESVTKYGKTASDTPVWYSDYTQGLIAKANAIASSPYQTYGQQRVAGFTPYQQSAFSQTPEVAMSYKPTLNSAIGMTQQAGQTSAMDAASPYLQAASARTPDVIGSYMNPYTSSVVDRIGVVLCAAAL